MIRVIVDRPIGFVDHFGNIYPVNYGFVPGLIAGDGKEQDAYILSKEVKKPIETFEGRLAAIIHRQDDVEDKWVITGQNEVLTVEDIARQTEFIEQHFQSNIEIL